MKLWYRWSVLFIIFAPLALVSAAEPPINISMGLALIGTIAGEQSETGFLDESGKTLPMYEFGINARACGYPKEHLGFGVGIQQSFSWADDGDALVEYIEKTAIDIFGEYIFFDWDFRKNSIQLALSPGVNYTFVTLDPDYLKARAKMSSSTIKQSAKASGFGVQGALNARYFLSKQFFSEFSLGYRLEFPIFYEDFQVFDGQMFSLQSRFGFQF